MKNKVLFALAAVSSVLCGCTKEQALNYNRPFSKAEFRDAFKPTASNVYMDENGQLIKINDPDDPTVNQLQRLKISDSVVSIYYSSSAVEELVEQKQLSVTPYPLKASIGKLTWSSDHPEIARVDQNGLVTAVSEGVATVTATSEIGVQASSKVFVNDKNVRTSVAAKSAKKILDTQKSASFDPVETVYVAEDYVSYTKHGDTVVSSSKFEQKFWASSKNAYFRITSDDEDVKTSGGSVVPSNAAYVFYTTDDYLSYIFCNSNGKSNYMSLDQAYLVDKGKTQFDALGEILQSFFVAGSAIMDRQFENVLSQEELETGYSGSTYIGSLGEDSGQFAYRKVSSQSGTIGYDQADDFGVPAGTHVKITDDIRYVWYDNLLIGNYIDEKIEYTLEGQDCVNQLFVNYYYQGRNVDLFWPDRANYSQVDSIFDL